jgi:hypothetical protein
LSHSTYLAQIQRCFDVPKQASTLDHPSLACDDPVYVVVVETLVIDNRISNNPFSLTAGKPPKVTDNRIQALFCNADLDGCFAMETLERIADNF